MAKTVKRALQISAVVALGGIIFLIVYALVFDGVRSFYCLSDDRCLTVWNRRNRETYIILGEYKIRKVPSDNYIKISDMPYGYVSIILSKDNKLLVDVEDSAKISRQSSNGLIELYRDNEPLNDSLYTYFDGKYRRYKKEVDYISIDTKENYATDKTGKKIE